eukprot:491805_1
MRQSNIQKSIQNNQWHPVHRVRTRSILMRKVTRISLCILTMKKKYKKQRHVSRQFQEAITVIQYENEDVMQLNEDQIRSQFEKEYEMNSIQMEHEKLNTSLTIEVIEDKMNQVLLRNDDLKSL